MSSWRNSKHTILSLGLILLFSTKLYASAFTDKNIEATITGDVSLEEPVSVDDNGGSITVDGSVAVSNFPATQPVSGTVAVSNFPVTQAVSGTVALSQTGTDNNVDSNITNASLPVTQSGTWTVDVTEPVTVDGTVAATQSGTWNINNIAGTISLPTGAATAANQLPNSHDVTVDNASGAAAVNIQDGGNTITVDGTITANAGTNLNTSALALEAGNLASILTSTQIIDDWDETDRAKVNLIVGQAGIAANNGVASATTIRSVYGKNRTYSAASPLFTPPATPTDMWRIRGVDGSVVRIERILLDCTQTVGGVNTFYLLKRSSLGTGGTITAITKTPHDSASAASGATPGYWTANPATLGTLVGSLDTTVWTCPDAALTTPFPHHDYDFTASGMEPIVLRSSTENIVLNFAGAALPAGMTLAITVTYTEE
ncbi:MAG: hypothetical protein ACHQ1D_00860 [Nitrososphaerales archaeon]